MTTERRKNALTVLTRLAQREPSENRWLLAALSKDPVGLAEVAIDVAIETGEPIAASLVQLLNTEPSAALVDVLWRKCPRYSIALRNLAVETARIRLATRT